MAGLAIGAESKPRQGGQIVPTGIGGGTAADLLHMRAAPDGADARPNAPSMKIEITCVDDTGQRFDSHEPGYGACLAKKGKK